MKKKQGKIIKKEKSAIKKEWKNILFNLIFAFLSLFSVAFLYKNVLLTTLLLILIAIVGIIKWKSQITIWVFIVGAIIGPLCEILAINFGAWQYAVSNIFNIPSWLFILWGNAAAFLYQTGIEIHNLGVKK